MFKTHNKLSRLLWCGKFLNLWGYIIHCTPGICTDKENLRESSPFTLDALSCAYLLHHFLAIFKENQAEITITMADFKQLIHSCYWTYSCSQGDIAKLALRSESIHNDPNCGAYKSRLSIGCEAKEILGSS